MEVYEVEGNVPSDYWPPSSTFRVIVAVCKSVLEAELQQDVSAHIDCGGPLNDHRKALKTGTCVSTQEIETCTESMNCAGTGKHVFVG